MRSLVYLIEYNENTEDYERNIEKIVEKSNFFDTIKNDENILLIFNPRDMNDSNYITKDVLEKIQNKILENQSESQIHIEDRLYHSKNSDESLEEILLNNNFDIKNINLNNEINADSSLLKIITDSQDMIVFTHFKGHSMAGFSGALKNLATSSIGIDGQKQLHKLAKPFISKIACLTCDECEKACDENAITVDSCAHINQELCDGCNVCISSCPNNAIKLNKLTSDIVIKSMCEIIEKIHIHKKNNKVLFINTLIDIKAYYDCNHEPKTLISKDIGILASYDPVALDKASYDLINEETRENIFIKLWPNVDGTLQFKYAEELGIGTQDYELKII